MNSERVAIGSIRIRQRIREDIGDLETLKNSLREYGLINPILLDDQYNLVAGERRLRAAHDLGWTDIDARILDPSSRVALFDLEVHENLLRKEFSGKEIAKSIETKKRLLHPPWHVRLGDWMLRLKNRLFPPRQRPVRPPASHR